MQQREQYSKIGRRRIIHECQLCLHRIQIWKKSGLVTCDTQEGLTAVTLRVSAVSP